MSVRENNCVCRLFRMLQGRASVNPGGWWTGWVLDEAKVTELLFVLWDLDFGDEMYLDFSSIHCALREVLNEIYIFDCYYPQYIHPI